MKKIIHRVNTLKQLKKIPKKYGVEIDLRAYNHKIILSHEPYINGIKLDTYLKAYSHSFIIFNIKEAGIENDVIKLAAKHKVNKYFLLDVEFPYLYRAARQGFRNIAVRYSEDEPIQTAINYKKYVDWVFIDCNTRLPLNKSIINKLSGLKTCLVSPERWGRPQDIPTYKEQMKTLNFKLNAVMTEFDYSKSW